MSAPNSPVRVKVELAEEEEKEENEGETVRLTWEAELEHMIVEMDAEAVDRIAAELEGDEEESKAMFDEW